MGKTEDVWLDLDPCYLALGTSDATRRKRYMAFVQEAVPESEARVIREALQRGQLTGNGRFVDEVEQGSQTRHPLKSAEKRGSQAQPTNGVEIAHWS
jgi:putative transposase